MVSIPPRFFFGKKKLLLSEQLFRDQTHRFLPVRNIGLNNVLVLLSEAFDVAQGCFTQALLFIVVQIDAVRIGANPYAFAAQPVAQIVSEF